MVERVMLKVICIGRLAVAMLLAWGSWAQADETATVQARAVMDEFITQFNARDEAKWADTLLFPHVRIASGSVLRPRFLPRLGTVGGGSESVYGGARGAGTGATKCDKGRSNRGRPFLLKAVLRPDLTLTLPQSLGLGQKERSISVELESRRREERS